MKNKKKKTVSSSETYWRGRYADTSSKFFKGASGNGKLPFRTRYKSKIINSVISTHSVESILDLGCGDGSLTSKIKCKKYFGIEIDKNLTDELRRQYENQPNYNFSTALEDSWPESFDLSLSIDVIFHLLEDEVYIKYMNMLFMGNAELVLIKSSNHDEVGIGRNAHILHRNFTKNISANFPEYKLIAKYGPRRKKIYLSISDRDLFFLYKRAP